MKTGYFTAILLTILITCICNNAHAEQKSRIAVLDFYADNIDITYAIAARTKIEVDLVRLGNHVIEQRNIKKLLSERGNDFPCKDPKCAARYGKMISADYVVVGEIIFADQYIITARIVEVENGRIIFADSAVSTKKEDILAMSGGIAAKLSNYMEVKTVKPVQTRPVNIRGCIDITGGYVMPIAYLRHVSKNGYSLMASAGASLDDFFIGMKSGYIQLFGSKTKSYAYIIPIVAVFRYDLSIQKFSISLNISAGISINYINEYKETSVQAMANPGLTLGYRTSMFKIYTLAEYFCIVEKKRGIQFLNFGFGASIFF